MDIDLQIQDRARKVFAGRPLITVGGVDRVYPWERIRRWSSGRLLTFEGARTGGSKGWEALVNTSEVSVQVELFDPENRAIVLVPPSRAVERVGGRPVFGGRLKRSLVWEQKVAVGERLLALGVPQPRFEVAMGTPRDLLNTWVRVSGGGRVATVWAVDGAEVLTDGRGVTLISDSKQAEAIAHALFTAGHSAVRIAEFVHGVPCSISVLITDDGVWPMPPVEQITVATERGNLEGVGTSSLWEPGEHLLAEMEAAASTIATAMQADGVRGFVTIDGIAGEQFVVNEVNSRPGASLLLLAETTGVPLMLLHLLVAAGEADGISFEQVGPSVKSALDGSGLCRATIRRAGVSGKFDEVVFLSDGRQFVVHSSDGELRVSALSTKRSELSSGEAVVAAAKSAAELRGSELTVREPQASIDVQQSRGTGRGGLGGRFRSFGSWRSGRGD